MPVVHANGLEIAYEEVGSGEPIVLVMGIGAQLVLWPEPFIEMLAARGFRVIRLDNRDVGLSTKLTSAGMPDPRVVIGRALAGLPVTAPYTLADMADDIAGLLDALGIASAHVLGVSLGGMIAQTTAIVHPHRVRSLTSIMSSPGGRRHMVNHPKALMALLSPMPRTAQAAEDWNVRLFTTVGSRGYTIHEDEIRKGARRSFERCDDFRGFTRQLAAVMATGDRRGALRFVRMPSLVMHGSDDTLILPSAGKATAKALPNSKFRLFQGMGHDLPHELWGEFLNEIEEVTKRGNAWAQRNPIAASA